MLLLSTCGALQCMLSFYANNRWWQSTVGVIKVAKTLANEWFGFPLIKFHSRVGKDFKWYGRIHASQYTCIRSCPSFILIAFCLFALLHAILIAHQSMICAFESWNHRHLMAKFSPTTVFVKFIWFAIERRSSSAVLNEQTHVKLCFYKMV